MSKFSTLPSPASPMTNKAGASAARRVATRTIQPAFLIFRNPSKTIWPAMVPVMVAFWPEAKSATAKSVPANVTPSTPSSNRWASRISVTASGLPWKAAALSTSRPALTKNARQSASVESQVAKRMASRRSASVFPKSRDPTIDECR